ncbi:MAG: TonB-dependent receptor [Bacteroidales bacterium]|nr:TonB-dependent receptor [Bacteroidales bacterium]
MKLTVFLCALSIMNVLANDSYPQNARLTLDLKSVTVEQVLQKIEEGSEFFFLYNSRLVDVTRKVDAHYKDMKIIDILEELFTGESIEYIVKDRQIILSSTNYESLYSDPSRRQQIEVSGTVVDAGGNTLPGVNIVEKGTENGTISDIDGRYTITVAGPEATLVFSFVGYLQEEIPVGSRTNINVTLVEDILQLDEVVVVGYGTVRKSDVTGALTSVTAETIQERPLQNALQAMQGKAAGVDVMSNIRPGEAATVRIRGNKSLTATESQKQPLYIVDGNVLMGDINTLNPYDIASIDILKDASATAIYGSRGANGVVLITTKKGSEGKVTVNYNGALRLDNIHSVTDWASSGHALDRLRLAYQNGRAYRIPYPDPAQDIQRFGHNDYWTIDAIRKGYEWEDPGTYTTPVMRETTQAERDKGWPDQVPVYNPDNIPTYDWIGLLTRTGVTHDHNISVSAGTERSSLYLSIGYLDNEGTQLNQSYNRFTTLLNGDIRPTDWLSVGASLNIAKGEQEYGSIYRTGSATGAKDLYGMALGMYPMGQPYDTSGNLIDYPGGNAGAPVWNPLYDVDNTEDKRWSTNFQGNLHGEIQFTPWLRYRVNFGAGLRYYRRGNWQGKESTVQSGAEIPSASAGLETDDHFQWQIENMLYFDKTFGEHAIGATFVQSAYAQQHEEADMSIGFIINDSPKWYDLAANNKGDMSDYRTAFSESQLASYLGRINYSFMDKYLLTASIRYDGSSVLAPGNKWDAFPSFAVGWKMHEEDFMKSIAPINQMKLRVGYGVTGNASVNPYVSSGPLKQYNYIFGINVATGYIPGDMPNPDLGWEKTAQTNIGLDFGLFRNRIDGTIEFYYSNIYDLLMTREIPAITGFTRMVDNIGRMKNRGLEITLNTVNISTRDFSWKTSINFATNHEEIVELVNGKEDMLSQGLNGNGWLIGQPANIFRTYEVDGIWQDTPEDSAEMVLWRERGSIYFSPGQYKPVDRNNNYMLEDSDKVVVGTINPKWVGGITNTLTYKNLSLSFFMYARIGQSYFANLAPGGVGENSYVSYVREEDPSNFWSPENPGAEYPQPTLTAANSSVRQATYINSGSYVIMRNISVSYNLPRLILDKVKVANCELYLQVLNPFIFGGKVVKAGINPEDENNWNNINSIGEPVGGTNNNRILIRSWVFGVRVGL